MNQPAALAVVLLASSFLLSLLAILRNFRTLHTEPDSHSDPDLVGSIEAVTQDWRALLPHLIELRQRLFYSVLILALTTAVAFTFTPQLLDVLTSPLPPDARLQAAALTDQLGMFMRIALTAGVVLAMPFIVTQIWIFIAQGLRPNERRYIYFFVPGATLLFIVGVSFAYFVMLPAALPFLLSIFPDDRIQDLLRLTDYVADVTRLLLWVGLSFQMPLVFTLLARVRLVSARQLLQGWRIALVGIAVAAALVTPTADPINMGLVMLPLFALYLLSVLLAALVRRGEKPRKPRPRLTQRIGRGLGRLFRPLRRLIDRLRRKKT